MKLKLIIPLLVLCLTLSVISVQAQTDTTENMNNVNMVLAGNTAESVTCNVTGNAVLVGMDNVTGGMGNTTGTMGNVTGRTENMTSPMTCSVTGKVILIRNMANMTEKAIVVGKIDNIPGKMIMFGKTDTGARMAGRMGNVTIITVGNMTGTLTCNMSRNMDNTTGTAERTGNMTGLAGRAENISVLMRGNINGTLTSDMTEKMVIIRNMGSMTEVARKMCNMSETAGRVENVTGRMDNLTGGTQNMTGPMTCNMTARMIVFKDMDKMGSMAERMDMGPMAERMNYLLGIDENTAAIEDTNNAAKMDENMDNISGMNNITGKVILIRNMDDTTQIITKNITCNITGNTTTVRNVATAV